MVAGLDALFVGDIRAGARKIKGSRGLGFKDSSGGDEDRKSGQGKCIRIISIGFKGPRKIKDSRDQGNA